MKLLSKYKGMSDCVLSYDQFKMFSDLKKGFSFDEGFDPASLDEETRAAILKRAEDYFDKPYPQVLASDFIRYSRIGDRDTYERSVYLRRQMLYIFAFAEAIEGKGRFLDRVMDGIWLVCDEADWVINAHIPARFALTPWAKDEHEYVDLFSAETGGTLAMVYMFCKKQLDGITPQICDRLEFAVYKRIIRPFLENEMYWMGFDGKAPNNWNPWIISNVLLACALTVKDLNIRERVVERSIIILDFFIDCYHTDGGCDEGPGYWGAAAASLFDCLELLYDMTGGVIDVFHSDLIRRMGEYEADFHICDSFFVNFADCSPRVNPGYQMIARFGRRTGSERLYNFAAHYHNKQDETANRWRLYRAVKNMLDDVPATVDYEPSGQSWYDGICVMNERECAQNNRGFFLACKGGHNNESHNHNDVGNFIVYHDGQPLIIDVGVGQYTKKTFSADRYKIWSMCSDYHNLPTINGCTQLPGEQYCASDVKYCAEDHSISLEISGAYPSDAGINSLRRTAKLDTDKVVITDQIKLQASGDAVFTLMVANKPQLSDGVIDFGDVVIEYSPSLTAVLDDFDVTMEDGVIKRIWEGYEVNRVLLKTAEFKEDTFTLVIKRKQI